MSERYIGAGVSLWGIPHDEWHYTFNLDAAIVAADVGKPVKFSANNTVALCADADNPDGVLLTFEDRSVEGVKVGAIGLKGAWKLGIPAAEATLAVGDQVLADGTGAVRSVGADSISNSNRTRVLAVDTTNDYAVVMFF